ncbi:hypothetical protein Bca4012_076628 [Brassica carinata]
MSCGQTARFYFSRPGHQRRILLTAVCWSYGEPWKTWMRSAFRVVLKRIEVFRSLRQSVFWPEVVGVHSFVLVSRQGDAFPQAGSRRCISAVRVGRGFGGTWSGHSFGIVGLVLSALVFVRFGLWICLAISFRHRVSPSQPAKNLPLVLRGEWRGCLSSFVVSEAQFHSVAASLDLLHPNIRDCCSAVFR